MSEGGQGGVSPTPESALAEILQRLTRLEQQITPLTPLYSLDQACTLLPCPTGSLRMLLYRHRHELDEPLYRRDSRSRRYRMLSHRDLLTLRAHLARPRRSRAQAMKELAA